MMNYSDVYESITCICVYIHFNFTGIIATGFTSI